MKKTKGKFKVEIRKTCKVCGGVLPKRYRTFCSAKCRNKMTAKRWSAYRTIKQREYNDRRASKPDKNKIKCEICGRYYRQVGTHIVQRHKMTAREYRKLYGFDVKRGQLPEDLRQLKERRAVENGTILNLLAGKEYWFRKGGKVPVYERSDQTLKRLRKIGIQKGSRRKQPDCLVCGKKLTGNQIKYCSATCRRKDYKKIYNKHKYKIYETIL